MRKQAFSATTRAVSAFWIAAGRHADPTTRGPIAARRLRRGVLNRALNMRRPGANAGQSARNGDAAPQPAGTAVIPTCVCAIVYAKNVKQSPAGFPRNRPARRFTLTAGLVLWKPPAPWWPRTWQASQAPYRDQSDRAFSELLGDPDPSLRASRNFLFSPHLQNFQLSRPRQAPYATRKPIDL